MILFYTSPKMQKLANKGEYLGVASFNFTSLYTYTEKVWILLV